VPSEPEPSSGQSGASVPLPGAATVKGSGSQQPPPR
jgi:hypothetical protein